MTTSRRDFLKTVFAASVVTTCGTEAIAKILPQIQEINGDIQGIYNLTLADFPTLATVGGSVVITIPKAPANVRRMVLTRKSADEFVAVSAFCTHQGVIVRPFNPTSNEIVCPEHGSRFAMDGTLIFGVESGQQSLKRFDTSYSAGSPVVGIEVPGLVGVEDEIENIFALNNYPNPASNQTTFTFILEKEENVVLKITNVAGEEIATIVRERFAAGEHTIPFKTISLASGTYFYHLTAGKTSQTKQLTIAR
jgi:Rieske Fe-S protein